MINRSPLLNHFPLESVRLVFGSRINLIPIIGILRLLSDHCQGSKLVFIASEASNRRGSTAYFLLSCFYHFFLNTSHNGHIGIIEVSLCSSAKYPNNSGFKLITCDFTQGDMATEQTPVILPDVAIYGSPVNLNHHSDSICWQSRHDEYRVYKGDRAGTTLRTL